MSQFTCFRPAGISILQAAPSTLRADIYQADDRELAGNSVLAQTQQQAAMADEKTGGLFSHAMWENNAAEPAGSDGASGHSDLPAAGDAHGDQKQSAGYDAPESSRGVAPAAPAHAIAPASGRRRGK